MDILLLSETKLDSSFPERQFVIPGHSTPHKVDRNCHDRGIFVREDIPAKRLSVENSPIVGFYNELNLRKKNWLLFLSYNPHRSK